MLVKLKDLYLFEWINLAEMNAIIDNSRRSEFKRWEIIMKQWETSDWNAYIIQKWSVIIERNWKIITTLHEWDIFWELALITEESRSADITAESDLILLKINKTLLFDIIRKFENWNSLKKTMIQRVKENAKF